MTWWLSDRADAHGQSMPCLQPLSHGAFSFLFFFLGGYMALKILPWADTAPSIFGFGAVSFF
jgi:hypothetical protein